MNTRLSLSVIAATAAFAFVGLTHAEPSHPLSGQKLDSGLGELPHYSQWADPSGRYPFGYKLAGESLDSGLGDLPHYSKWKDKTGRNPLGKDAVRLSLLSR